MNKILTILFFLLGTLTFSQKIYVGDLVHLKIESQRITTEEIKEKFKDFEIERLDKKGEIYNVVFRSFKPGNHEILLGNKRVSIQVASVLNEEENKQREKIYMTPEDGEVELNKGEKPIPMTYLSIGGAIFLFVLIIFIILKYFRKRNQKIISAYEIFINDIKKVDGEKHFFKLTNVFKDYIHNRYNKKVKGKTSKEILKEVPAEFDKEKLKNWLDFADLCKFSGLDATQEEKDLYKNMLVEIVKKSEQGLFEVE